jgi:hypothetical protein
MRVHSTEGRRVGDEGRSKKKGWELGGTI